MKRKATAILVLIGILFSGCSLLTETEAQQAVTSISISESPIVIEEKVIEQEPQPEEPVETPKEVYITESPLPDGDFMEVVSFPDWTGSVNNTLAVNSLYGFKGFAGQGKAYVTVSETVESFRMFINDVSVDTSAMMAGHTYLLDFSNVAKTGTNTLQVSNVYPKDASNVITVSVSYPCVLAGLPEDVGISPQVTELIADIVSTDVEYGFPSAQLAIVKDGRLVYDNAWGVVNAYTPDLTPMDNPTPVTTDTLYDLASNTKMFTVNYAVMYLLSRDEIDLDATIVSLLGEEFVDRTLDVQMTGYYKCNYSDVLNWKRNITVREVLSHEAGFPASPKYEYPTLKGNDNLLFTGNDGSFETRENTYEAILKTPLVYEPGTKTEYSDVDYMLMCFIVEKITGKRLDEFVKETFLDPLSLTHTTFRPLDNGFSKEDCAATELAGNTREGVVTFDGIRTETCWGEVHDEKAYYSMAGISGHAGLYSNASDLAILASVMLTGGYENTQFFSDDVIDAFTACKDYDEAYWGLGWWRSGKKERLTYFSSECPNDTFGHQGWTGTITVIDPEENMVIVYLTNCINTPIINKRSNSNGFEGRVYTSGTLGFATDLIYRGLNGDEEYLTESLTCLVEDMVNESYKLIPQKYLGKENNVYMKNYHAKEKVYEHRISKYPIQE